ncbi:site-specific integrase [Marinilabilia rubra]|uniref:Recombinase n=1 Tax=Marinilabilia rubra TaxID=2162893 RepID=A0A2U2B577_9BACT|nr:site-specific integrase [Marinilabilia rubra]PWD98230.1 recombinase [Marinilabilia rubra]
MSGLENVKILFFIKRTKLLKNGEAPIFVRITINKERTEFAAKKSLKPKYWSDAQQKAKNTAPEAEEINEALNRTKKRLLSIIDYLSYEEEPVTPRLVQERFLGKKEQRRTILKIFEEHNENAKKLVGIDFAPGTVERYETSYKHTRDFIHWRYKREDLALDDLNQQFVKDYELYFKTVRKCSHNSTTKYLKNFKKIVRIALANGWMKKDPFATIKFKLQQIDAVYLTAEELEAMRKKKLHIDRIDQIRDVFLFCCYTGLAFADVKGLKAENLETDKDGFLWIHKKRQKSHQMSTIFVIDAARRLLEKYKGKPELQDKGLLLPVLSNQKMNSYLKEIADLCGINKKITTHTARHTFATTVALENDMPLEVVSKTLGHSNIKMTQRYARTTENLIKKNMQKIADMY